MNWLKLIGKEVKALRGYVQSGKVPLNFILFDDGATFIKLEEQCPITYHDCNHSARTLELCQDEEMWQEMYTCKGCYDEADDASCHF